MPGFASSDPDLRGIGWEAVIAARTGSLLI
jgi:hypothetical protein